MKPYEAIIIFNPAATEDKIGASVAKFEKKIKDSEGTDITVTKWGTRKLASTISRAKKATEGYYVLINFNGEGKTPNELKSLLNVSEEVIRYSVIASRPEQAAEPKEEKVEIEPSMIIPTVPSGQGEQAS